MLSHIYRSALVDLDIGFAAFTELDPVLEFTHFLLPNYCSEEVEVHDQSQQNHGGDDGGTNDRNGGGGQLGRTVGGIVGSRSTYERRLLGYRGCTRLHRRRDRVVFNKRQVCVLE